MTLSTLCALPLCFAAFMAAHDYDLRSITGFTAAYKQAHVARDRELLRNLIYWGTVPASEQNGYLDHCLQDFTNALSNVEFKQLTDEDRRRLSNPDGTFWTPLPPVGMLCAQLVIPTRTRHSEPTPAKSLLSTPVGRHGGRYYLNIRLTLPSPLAPNPQQGPP